MRVQHTEGYLTLATGKRHYLELALNLALSIRLKDKRPICLLHDKEMKIPAYYKRYFDFLIEIEPKDLKVGMTNKLLLFKYSPFRRTMFIDADSLLIKKDIDFFWNKLKRYHFTVQGFKVKRGKLWHIRVESYIKKMKIPYMIRTNSGVIYFDKSKTSKKVFDKMNDYYETQRDIVSLKWRSRGEYQDEPIICTAMASYNLDPIPQDIDGKSLMFSTGHSKNVDIDVFKGICSFIRSISQVKRECNVSPTICHFIQLKPKSIYIREMQKLRKYFWFQKINKKFRSDG